MPDLQGCVYGVGGRRGQWERMDPHTKAKVEEGRPGGRTRTDLAVLETPPLLTAPWPPCIQLHQEWPPWARAAGEVSSWCGWNTRETCLQVPTSFPRMRPMTSHESTEQTEPLLQLIPQALS